MAVADVSVIVPFYNRKKFISAGIKSLKNQDLQSISFILVDDGSTDNSLELVKKLTEGDSRFIVIHQEANRGPSAARNLGIKYISSKYVGFFDIDDSIPADYFKTLFQKAEDTDGDIIFTNYNLSVHRVKQHEIFDIKEKIQALKNGAVWDKLFRWDKIKDITFESGLYCADNLFLFNAINLCKKMILIEKPVYKYQVQNDSISVLESKKEKRKKDIFLILKKIMNCASKYNYSSEEISELKKYLVRSLFKYQNDREWAKNFLDFLGYKYENLFQKIASRFVRNFFEKSHANQAASCPFSHSIFCSRRASALM